MQEPRKVVQSGRVVRWWTERSYGFITPDDGGPDVFVHRGDLSDTQHAAIINTDVRVTFDVEPSERGPKAVRVEVIPLPYREAPPCPDGPAVVGTGQLRTDMRRIVTQHADALVNDLLRVAERNGWSE